MIDLWILEGLIRMKNRVSLKLDFFYREGLIRMKNFYDLIFFISDSNFIRLFDQLGFGLCIAKG